MLNEVRKPLGRDGESCSKLKSIAMETEKGKRGGSLAARDLAKTLNQHKRPLKETTTTAVSRKERERERERERDRERERERVSLTITKPDLGIILG